MAHFYVHCPQCGLKFNINASSVGTMRRCQNCGNRFVITEPPPAPASSSLRGCVIAMLALLCVGAVVVVGCCGLGMIGSTGTVATPPAAPVAPARTHELDPVPAAESVPMSETLPAQPVPIPTEQKPETPAAAPTFNAAAIVLTPEETTDRTRTFKSTDGKFSVEAVLLAMRDEVAHLKRVDNGSVIEVPMAKLANSDRIWIRKFAAADKIRNRY